MNAELMKCLSVLVTEYECPIITDTIFKILFSTENYVYGLKKETRKPFNIF